MGTSTNLAKRHWGWSFSSGAVLGETGLPSGERTYRTLSGGAPHPGFTLVELLLVLAVVATLGTIAFPRVTRSLERADHQAAAEGIQTVLAQLRLQAIETGRPHSFRFQSGSSLYEVRAVAGDEVEQIDFDSIHQEGGEMLDDSLKGGAKPSSWDRGPIVDWAGAADVTREVALEASRAQANDATERYRLENEIVLVSKEGFPSKETTEFDESADLFAEDAALPEDESLPADRGENLLSSEWSFSIVFYPDGRADDAQLAIVASSGHAYDITVVGMSGRVQLGPGRRFVP